MPSDSEKITSLEQNYSRMADGMHRIATSVEKQGTTLDKAMKIIVGHIDPETNTFVPGAIHRIDEIEKKQTACLSRQSNRIRLCLKWAGGIIGTVTTAFLLAHFGLN